MGLLVTTPVCLETEVRRGVYGGLHREAEVRPRSVVLWTSRPSSQPRPRRHFCPCSPRAACGRGQASVVAHGPSAVVRVRSGSGEQSVALCRLDGPRAARELKEQLFSMAARLTRPDRKRSAHTLHHSPPCCWCFMVESAAAPSCSTNHIHQHCSDHPCRCIL